jgi:ElaB/YqjD/DUF883 family membrane-anchored ribosome-binding protein
MTETTWGNKDKVINELRAVISDAEEMLRMTADEVGDSAAGLRGRIKDRMNKAKDDLTRLQDAAIDKAREVGDAADEFVHENPWKSIGIAAGIGLVVGMLVSRR